MKSQSKATRTPIPRKIVLGVTGSIAAYKAADLVSTLVKAGHDVTVIMTECSKRFVGEQTFLTLSRNPVVTSLWELPEWKPGHVALADMASLLIVAPCTANFMGKYAAGIADDALTTFAISFDGKVLLAPAMNTRMWRHPATRCNRETLESRGVVFVGPDAGLLACGDEGEGRMCEVKVILDSVASIL